MIIFRPHRGSLVDAMNEAREFNGVDEMKDFIVRQWDGNILKENIVIDDRLTNDNRNGWKDTRYVCAIKIGEESFAYPQCIGMCATIY